MKNKILICLLVLSMCLVLVGCGKKEEKENNINNETNTNQTNEDNNNTNNDNNDINKENIDDNNNNPSDDVVVDDDEIIDIEDEDNTPPSVEKVTVSEVINCNNCVYAYFSAEGDNAKRLGDSVIASEYTTDVNTLKTSGGKQRHNFFGLVLSGNTISRAYACILKDNKIYCLEGSTNGAYHDSNVAILNQIFNSDQCKTISDGNTYTCSDGSYNGDSKKNGYTSMHYETSCTIYSTDSNAGKLICH